MDALVLLIGLGVVAGALTTLAGLGGGILLLLALALIWDPARALACTAPALLVGNLHRVWMFRDAVDRSKLRAFAWAAVPAAIGGGLFAAAIEPRFIHALLIATTALCVLRSCLRWDWRVPQRAMFPAGIVIGGLTGASGGAGMLLSPFLLSSGLAGVAYVATGAGCAVAMHGGRILGYALGGMFTRELLLLAAVTTLAIVGGNLIGKRLRQLTARLPANVLEQSVLVVCVTLAVAGIGK